MGHNRYRIAGGRSGRDDGPDCTDDLVPIVSDESNASFVPAVGVRSLDAVFLRVKPSKKNRQILVVNRIDAPLADRR